jgi:hypothetical protein
MRNVGLKRSCVLSLLVLTCAVPASAQQAAQPALTLQATGRFGPNGTFTGTLTVNRFEQQGAQIVAIGIVQGTLRQANRVIGTALAAEVMWPVQVRAGGAVAATRRMSGTPTIRQIGWSTSSPQFRVIPAQAGCTPAQVNLGATTVNLLGLDVALDAVGLTVTGQAGTQLGDLVCAVADVLRDVTGLVNLLNSLLGTLTNLAGGVGVPII